MSVPTYKEFVHILLETRKFLKWETFACSWSLPSAIECNTSFCVPVDVQYVYDCWDFRLDGWWTLNPTVLNAELWDCLQSAIHDRIEPWARQRYSLGHRGVARLKRIRVTIFQLARRAGVADICIYIYIYIYIYLCICICLCICILCIYIYIYIHMYVCTHVPPYPSEFQR